MKATRAIRRSSSSAGPVDVAVGRGANASIVGRLGTGEVFGEMSLIDPGPRSATITAACDTECLAASYQDFVAAIEENPERAVGFMKTLVRRLRKMNELLESLEPRRARASRHASGVPAVGQLAEAGRSVLDDAVVTSRCDDRKSLDAAGASLRATVSAKGAKTNVGARALIDKHRLRVRSIRES